MFQKTTVPVIVTITLLLVQVACIPFGDSWVQFSGHVKDTEGKPIKGAQIKILFDGKPASERSETQSNEAGEYKFFENSCPCEFEFVVIAAKDGYKTYTKKMTGKEANNLKELEIVLERADGATPTPNNSFNRSASERGFHPRDLKACFEVSRQLSSGVGRLSHA